MSRHTGNLYVFSQWRFTSDLKVKSNCYPCRTGVFLEGSCGEKPGGGRGGGGEEPLIQKTGGIPLWIHICRKLILWHPGGPRAGLEGERERDGLPVKGSIPSTEVKHTDVHMEVTPLVHFKTVFYTGIFSLHYLRNPLCQLCVLT